MFTEQSRRERVIGAIRKLHIVFKIYRNGYEQKFGAFFCFVIEGHCVALI